MDAFALETVARTAPTTIMRAPNVPRYVPATSDTGMYESASSATGRTPVDTSMTST